MPCSAKMAGVVGAAPTHDRVKAGFVPVSTHAKKLSARNSAYRRNRHQYVDYMAREVADNRLPVTALSPSRQRLSAPVCAVSTVERTSIIFYSRTFLFSYTAAGDEPVIERYVRTARRRKDGAGRSRTTAFVTKPLAASPVHKDRGTAACSTVCLQTG